MTEPKERPIIFSGGMVRAILIKVQSQGRKRICVRGGEDKNAPEHLMARLLNGVKVNEETGCWEWQRSRNSKGYGQLTVNGRQTLAHRLMFRLTRLGKEGECALHSCDNSACINPEHLHGGNQSQNMKECNERGRSRIPIVRLKGEANGASKLSMAQVKEIRKHLADGVTHRVIAKKFGISPSNVSYIKRGFRW